MSRVLTATARNELVKAVRQRYRWRSREAKTRILEEFASISGYHRKSAIRILNGTPCPPDDARGRCRPRVYDEAVRQALVVLWEASDRVCGKRLRALVPGVAVGARAPRAPDAGRRYSAEVLATSAATLERCCVHPPVSNRRRPRRRLATLRKNVPVRTFAEWEEPLPGDMEADLVSHGGDSAAGSFVHTLTLTDVASGWTECVALVVRDGALVAAALEQLRQTMPFPLRGFDTDNGGEFMNETVAAYCHTHGIPCTRSRPYHKNDQAWVEQKNGAVVRRLAGYRRLEGLAAAAALSRLYAASRLFVNFFQPSFKLREKVRTGTRVVKRYHAPATPCARLLACCSVSGEVKARLQEITTQLDPLQLLDEIRKMQYHLVRIAAGAQSYVPGPQKDDLSRFLESLSTAWRAGEVRPTHRPRAALRRYWRTRPDAFKSVWPQVCEWLEGDPDLTGLGVFERLQREHPGVFQANQLRTVQRRLKQWRVGMVLYLGIRRTCRNR